MAEKDITDKVLEDYEDVFADIVNGLVFNGKYVVSEDELQDILPASFYKAFDRKLHEEERDVAKRWKRGLINIAVLGIENQTEVYEPMPLRVIAYDGSSYRAQLTEFDAQMRKWRALKQRNESTVSKDNDRNNEITKAQDAKTDNDVETLKTQDAEKPVFHPVPVLTIVLYFGKEHWDKHLRLKELLEIPEEMDPLINDYKINVFEVAWLTDDQIKMFHSDFRIVAKFFSEKRKNPEYVPDDPSEIRHVDEVLKLIAAVTGDDRYKEIITDKEEEEEVKNMCEVADRLEKRGMEKGIIEGRKEGMIKALYDLVSDGLLSISDAAVRAGMTEQQFKAAGSKL